MRILLLKESDSTFVSLSRVCTYVAIVFRTHEKRHRPVALVTSTLRLLQFCSVPSGRPFNHLGFISFPLSSFVCAVTCWRPHEDSRPILPPPPPPFGGALPNSSSNPSRFVSVLIALSASTTPRKTSFCLAFPSILFCLSTQSAFLLPCL